MKLPATPSSALLIFLCSVFSTNAQLIEVPSANLNINENQVERPDFTENASFASNKNLSGVYQLPVVHKTSGDFSESDPIYISQDGLTLSTRSTVVRSLENILDLSVLREPSAYRNALKMKLKVSDSQANGIQAGLAEISAAYQKRGQKVDAADCSSVSLSVGHRIQIDSSKVLEVVESEVTANPDCACEIVKTAIKQSSAGVELVADIAEVAITSAPGNMRMISQCAIAAMPEALPAIQAVLARLDPNGGDSGYSAKDSKSGKDAIASAIAPPSAPPNPLDTPSTTGGPPGGSPLTGGPLTGRPLTDGPPIFFPPPPVTNPNP